MTTGAASLLTAAAGGKLILLDRQVFTSSGTWTKPTAAGGNVAAGTTQVLALVRAIGGGNGGTSGGNTNAGTYGTSAPVTERNFPVSILGATETVTIGSGGAGGVFASTTNGVAGATGSASAFGTWALSRPAPVASSQLASPTGNGGAGGNTSGSVLPNIGTAGAAGDGGAVSTAGGNSNSNGAGQGGGGGGGATSTAGGAGGNYGGGGGGGGSGANGGAGGPGAVLVEIWGYA